MSERESRSEFGRFGRSRRVPTHAVILAVLLVVSPPAFGTSTIETLGDVGQIVVPATGLAVAAVHKDGKGAAQLAEAFGTTMAIVYILKPTIDRTRPNGGGQSFPSGHAASAFAGAAFLQIRYGWTWGIPAYAAAAFVGESRVESKQHWTSDVIGGGAIGIVSNLVFTRRYRKLSVQPIVGRDGVGLALAASW